MTRFARNTCIVFLLTIVALPVVQVKAAATDIKPFQGRWAMYVPGGAAWLEVKTDKNQDGGNYPAANILWYGGSVVPTGCMPYVDEKNTLIVERVRTVPRRKNADGKVILSQQLVTRIECSLSGADEMACRFVSPQGNGRGVDVREFTAKRIPALPPAPDLSKIKYGKPISLFSGKEEDLSLWKPTNARAKNGFKVIDGTLVNDPLQPEGRHISYGNLRTVQEFGDFNIKLEVNVPQRSNSGVYLKGIYEVQVADTHKRSQARLDSHNMGGIYSRITPIIAAERPANQWQSMDITLCDRHVTVILNGTRIIENEPVYGVTGGALTPDEFADGPIYLQGDHGMVRYRNIVLTPIVE